MKLSQFNFNLPDDAIALYPHVSERTIKRSDGTTQTFQVTRRDEARMMVIHRKSQTIDLYNKDVKGEPTEDDYIKFKDVSKYFDDGDVMVFNDTKVFPARLYGTKEKTDAKIEVFLLRELNAEMRLWDVLVEPARKIRIGNKLFFDDTGTMVAEVIDNTTSRGRTLRFLYDCPHDEFKRELYALGQAPLPHYIIDHTHEETVSAPTPNDPNATKTVAVQDRPYREEDMDDFQTVFAREEGAVTAPATGLHFSREMMKMLEIKGINTAFITLHCGLGNFNQIEVEDLTKHKMESEQMFINKEACDTVNKAKLAGKRICVVGTSVAKATETAVGTDNLLKEYEGWTNKFIFPPYEFGLANAMLANFYHPESTLMMSACAFGGYDITMKAYELALKNGYKFGCFGDGMLILDD